MKLGHFWYRFGAVAGAVFLVLPATSQNTKPQPLVIPLQCAGGDCPLLTGVPSTAGMRNGFVRLLTDASVGWHTTGKNEESLVILQGQGLAMIEGQTSIPFTAPAVVYIPPTTRHNIKNTGELPLQYVYVVASAKK